MKRTMAGATLVPVYCASALLLLAPPAASAAEADVYRAGTLCDFRVSIEQTGAQAQRVELPNGDL
jgi:hypothetical protein